MKFTFKYTFSDYYESLKLNYSSSKLRFILPLSGFFLLFFNIYNIAFIDVLFIISIILSLLLIFFPYTILRFQAYWIFNHSPYLKQDYEYEITEKDIKVKSDLENGSSRWESFIKNRNNDKILLLYKSPVVMMMFPRHVISQKDWRSLLELVKTKINKQ